MQRKSRRAEISGSPRWPSAGAAAAASPKSSQNKQSPVILSHNAVVGGIEVEDAGGPGYFVARTREARRKRRATTGPRFLSARRLGPTRATSSPGHQADRAFPIYTWETKNAKQARGGNPRTTASLRLSERGENFSLAGKVRPSESKDIASFAGNVRGEKRRLLAKPVPPALHDETHSEIPHNLTGNAVARAGSARATAALGPRQNAPLWS